MVPDNGWDYGAFAPSLRELDRELIDERGFLRVVPARALLGLPPSLLRVYAHFRAIYVFPTEELIDLLRLEIGGRTAIEIGAGHGSIARALGIPATDSYIQTTPHYRAIYDALKAPIVKPASDVERLDAACAVEKYRPEVVVAAYVTQLWKDHHDTHGHMFGVEEEELLGQVTRYIHVGNYVTHGQKRLLRRPHRVLSKPKGLVTRAAEPEQNAIWIWDA